MTSRSRPRLEMDTYTGTSARKFDATVSRALLMGRSSRYGSPTVAGQVGGGGGGQLVSGHVWVVRSTSG